LFVAGYDGVVCSYEINTNDGGECKQISQYLLFNMCQSSNNQQTTTMNDGRNTAGKFINIHYQLEVVSFSF